MLNLLTKIRQLLNLIFLNNSKAKPHHLLRGQWAEDEALKYLIRQDLKLICRNYHSKYGEIDLIMQEKNILVFVEVRFRKSNRYGSAMESITHSKQTKIINTTNYYLATHPNKCPIRFDTIAISLDQKKEIINWIKNAFGA